jgi:hypothetical protein
MGTIEVPCAERSVERSVEATDSYPYADEFGGTIDATAFYSIKEDSNTKIVFQENYKNSE